jgi:hypothetical protein
LQAFAKVWIEPNYKRFTSTREGRDPAWNERLSFPVPEYFFQQPQASVSIEVFNRGILSDKFLGGCRIPLHEILHNQASSASSASSAPSDPAKPAASQQVSTHTDPSTYPLLKKSGKKKGSIRVAIHVGEKVVVAAPPVAYAQPQPGYYAQPQPGYYAQPQPGYYAQPQQGYYGQRPQGRFGGGGMGFGTGLLAGAVGGLLVGEMIDDFGDMGGGGFDGGF